MLVTAGLGCLRTGKLKYTDIDGSHVMKPIILALTIQLVAGCNVLAQQANSTNKDGAYTWYDGGVPRTVWIDNSHVAELPGNNGGSREGIKIVPADEARSTGATARGNTVPVFRDGPSGGRMRTIPGNIIVQLHPDWNAAQVTQWLQANRLTEVHRMSNNFLVIASPPGLASVELANRLQESGTVVYAQPDWWEQTKRR